MRTYFDRYVYGQNRLGIYTNLWPTKLNALDRRVTRGWYLTFHLGSYRLAFIGRNR